MNEHVSSSTENETKMGPSERWVRVMLWAKLTPEETEAYIQELKADGMLEAADASMWAVANTRPLW